MSIVERAPGRFDWRFISYEQIISRLFTFKDKIKRNNYVYGIPKGGLMLRDTISELFNIKIIENLDEVNSLVQDGTKILIVDDISDSGNTLKEMFEQYKFKNRTNVTSLTLLTKITSSFIPDVSLFTIRDTFLCNNAWYFGFGMDLFKYKNIGILRDWPHIGWCVKKIHIDDDYFLEHPIVEFMRKIGLEDELGHYIDDEGYIDFTKIV